MVLINKDFKITKVLQLENGGKGHARDLEKKRSRGMAQEK